MTFDEFDEDEYEEVIEEVEFIEMSADPRAEKIDIEEDPEVKDDTERLFYEVDSIKEKRNKIITLHLYIEKAIDRIINLIYENKKRRFFEKIELLQKRGIINNDQFHNIKIINDLRNDYAHTLEIESIESKYLGMVENLKLSGYVFANPHHDKFQLIVHQILFELKYIYNKERAKKEGKKIEKGLTDIEIKGMLEKNGILSWQLCKILKCEKEGYDETYHLQCPYCNQGEIIRKRDATPGFKDSYFIKCPYCGLDGDGSMLNIGTIKTKSNLQ